MSRPSYLPRGRDLAAVVLHYEDDEMAREFPALYDLLTMAKREGRYRAGARLTLFCEDGRLKASVWDPDTSQVWFATLEAFSGALEAIEGLLVNNRGEWRAKRDQNGKR